MSRSSKRGRRVRSLGHRAVEEFAERVDRFALHEILKRFISGNAVREVNPEYSLDDLWRLARDHVATQLMADGLAGTEPAAHVNVVALDRVLAHVHLGRDQADVTD